MLDSDADRGPLRVMFLHTFMSVGGAETLLVDLIRRLDRRRFLPELCCLKYLGPLGEMLAGEVPTFTGLLAHKYDLRVLPRLVALLRRRRIDAVVTVGAGDRMFWGRLAAVLAGVPVRLAALHSTGWPDCVGRLNRLLTPITDGFIGVAPGHGRYLVQQEGFPQRKVFVIPNGVDTDRYRPRPADPRLRAELGIPPGVPVAGIVAALRPEKNHELFLRVAARVRRELPGARFLIVGDGPERPRLEAMRRELSLDDAVHFAGTRSDVPELLALVDVVTLTSRMEANPVSLLEAMAVQRPVVAPAVGSIPDSVVDGLTGYLTPPADEGELARSITRLLADHRLAAQMGRAGREKVLAEHSLERMVDGYQDLIERVYFDKRTRRRPAADAAAGPGPPDAVAFSPPEEGVVCRDA